jgi:hypothetical protein
MLDEGLAAFLGEKPDRVVMKVDWGEQLEARLTGVREKDDVGSEGTSDGPVQVSGSAAADLPPALAAMIEQREADQRDAVEAARVDALVVLPAGVWREIQARAASIGVAAELLEEGSELHLSAELPTEDGPEA